MSFIKDVLVGMVEVVVVVMEAVAVAVASTQAVAVVAVASLLLPMTPVVHRRVPPPHQVQDSGQAHLVAVRWDTCSDREVVDVVAILPSGVLVPHHLVGVQAVHGAHHHRHHRRQPALEQVPAHHSVERDDVKGDVPKSTFMPQYAHWLHMYSFDSAVRLARPDMALASLSFHPTRTS